MGNVGKKALENPSQVLLDKFNLGFNRDDVLKQFNPDTKSITDKGFEFDVYQGNSRKNQERYEALGEIMDEVIFEKLEKVGELKRIYFPDESTLQSFFFASENYDKKDKLMILIHGAGVVRAGQWTRKLIINNGLEQGSQLPFIKRSKDLDFGVIVLNTNYNKIDGKRIPNSGSPEEHAEYVWKTYVQKCKASKIAIVAHSYGGVVTMELAKRFPEDFQNRVFHLSMTDSVHNCRRQDVSGKVLENLQRVGINYVTSNEKLGTELEKDDKDVPRFSAGHTQHEWTSFSSMEAIFEKLQNQLVPEASRKRKPSEDL